ncbi:NADP-dependent oxidoreductase domain-containing protein [Aspergillus terricola var. indicus]
MSIGEAWSDLMGSMNKESSFKLLDAFVEAGGNFIDTSNNYQSEQSESWLGDWMASRNNRDRIVRDSLKKLQADWIDILYVHWWDYTTSIEELMDSLQIMVEQGKVLYLGISDAPAWVVSAANTYARAHGKTPFSVYQGRWNVMLRGFERDIIPMALHFGMALAPWDVLGGGRFQTTKALEERRKAGEELRSMLGPGEQTADEAKMSEALGKVAAEHGIERFPNVFPIVGGRKVEHLSDNIQALKIKLTPEQVAYLESVRPLDPGFPHDMIGTDPRVSGVPSPWVNFGSKLALQPALMGIPPS